MTKIDTNLIEEAVYNLCIKANTQYNRDLYEIILNKYIDSKDTNEKQKLANILNNIKIACGKKRPLCQDTGQVLVFLEIGQNVQLTGKPLNDAVNDGTAKAYKENFYRKSVVQDAIFNRTNTDTNTPAVIYTDIVTGDKVEIKLLIKGAGSENYSTVQMFKPTSEKEEIFEFIKESIMSAGEKSCPPLVLGLGFGGTMDSAAVMSKKAFFKTTQNIEEKQFIDELLNYLQELKNEILEVKMMTSSTHIACLPAALTINCHSTRHENCTVTDKEILYETDCPSFKTILFNNDELIELNTKDTDKIKSLKKGDKILLTGEIYTARDAAHKKMAEYFQQNNRMIFDLKDKILFYAGPCPAAPDEIIGPIGPTTSARMDKFSEFVFSNGLQAAIGKGERSKEALDAIKKYKGKYFTCQGGISCLLAQCVKKSEVTAFEELGTEAVRKLYVEKLPLTVEI